MISTKEILSEIDRSKQLFQFTTKPKKKVIPETVAKTEGKIEEGKIVTLSEFLNH